MKNSDKRVRRSLLGEYLFLYFKQFSLNSLKWQKQKQKKKHWCNSIHIIECNLLEVLVYVCAWTKISDCKHITHRCLSSRFIY